MIECEQPTRQTAAGHPYQALDSIIRRELSDCLRQLAFGEAYAINIVDRYVRFSQGVVDDFQGPFTMVEGSVTGLKTFARRGDIGVTDIG